MPYIYANWCSCNFRTCIIAKYMPLDWGKFFFYILVKIWIYIYANCNAVVVVFLQTKQYLCAKNVIKKKDTRWDYKIKTKYWHFYGQNMNWSCSFWCCMTKQHANLWQSCLFSCFWYLQRKTITTTKVQVDVHVNVHVYRLLYVGNWFRVFILFVQIWYSVYKLSRYSHDWLS